MAALRDMLRPPEPVLLRHGAAAVAVHWLNAACVTVMLVTGLAVMPEAAESWSEASRWRMLLHENLGGKAGLLLAHAFAGWAWAVSMLLLAVLRPRPTLRFLTAIFTVPPGAALRWAVRDNLRFLRGRGPAEHRGRYTPGQRMYAQAVVLGFAVAAVSGTLMALPRLGAPMAEPAWALPAHSLSVTMSLGFIAFHACKKILLENRGVPFSDFLRGGMPRSRAVRRHGLDSFDRERKA